MMITIWILFIFFSMVGVSYTLKFFGDGVNGVGNIIFWIISMVVVALTAGAIWGDLLIVLGLD